MSSPTDVRRALGLAVQILEELPDHLRPKSNIEDMRGLLEGQSSGRDGVIVVEAIATALAWRTQQMIANPPRFDDTELGVQVHNNRLSELTALFELVRQADARTFAIYFVQACGSESLRPQQ